MSDSLKRAISALELTVFCALLLGAGAFVVAARTRTNWDQDIWWHLRTGQWMVEHGQLPQTDPFSQYGHGKPWIVYSWLFDLIAYAAQHALGLRGLVLLSALLGLLIAAALYVLLRGLGAPLVVAAAVNFLGFDAMMPLTTPRPWLFSMLFFLIELCVIVSAHRIVGADPSVRPGPTPFDSLVLSPSKDELAQDRHGSAPRSRQGRVPAVLWLLPPLFIVWANIHVQFAIGLVVLAAAVCDALWHEGTVAALRWLLITAVCATAALVNPYHIGVYTIGRELMAQSALWTRIGELLAPDFRQSTDWITLAMTLAGAGCLGWQIRTWGPPSGGPTPRPGGPPRVFFLLLLALGAYLGFKSRRDTWLTVTAAACAIAATPWDELLGKRDGTRFPGWVGAIAATAMTAIVAAAAVPFMSEERLAANVARTYPAAAAAFIEKHQVTGPLYNYFDWGGYLMWRLPELPVHMDGRTVVHGEPRILTHVDTWQGKPSWRDDAELNAARIVIGPRDQPLMSLLRLDDRFTVIYEDREGPAVVFEARLPLAPLAFR